MSYAAAIEALNAMAPELYTRPGAPRRKFSLAEIGVLLRHLNNPHHRFQSILIAGTNGKGSTAATLSSILIAAGLRTGLYTSPHLERVNERIRVGGAEITDADFARHFFAVREASESLVQSAALAQMPSFFEVLTAVGFLHFAEQGIDVAVLEVGMGGRLDATNIVDPLISIITDISLDHMEWLGSTIAVITREKAGILRPRGVLVTLPQHPEANQALGEVAVELEVRGVPATPYMPAIGTSTSGAYAVEVTGPEIGSQVIEVNSPLTGAHQHRNIALAIAAAVELAEHHGFPITPAAIAEGIRATRWPGRLESIRIGDISWILDVAHNPAGARALRAGLRDSFEAEFAGRPKTLVFSCLRDKPLPEMAQILFPVFDRVIFAPISSLRAASVADLLAAADATGTLSHAADSVEVALHLATEITPGGVVVISGSVYLVGEARHVLRERLPVPAGSRA